MKISRWFRGLLMVVGIFLFVVHVLHIVFLMTVEHIMIGCSDKPRFIIRLRFLWSTSCLG
jgi:hypothetical protein